MYAIFTALVIALPLAALSGPHQESTLPRRHQNISRGVVRRAAGYRLKDNYKGEDFLKWNFFTYADPTGGNVDYVDAQEAEDEGLAYVDSSTGATVLAVDDTSSVPAGGQRKSVRITSPQTYNTGLFIADIVAMPYGCGVWPAYWMDSADGDWPNGGEIDIIEGVNLNSKNQITLHTNQSCSISSTEHTSSTLLGTHCNSTSKNDAGCSYRLSSTASFGKGFNAAGGGVYALRWESSGLDFWFFTRSKIPADITSGTPDPSSWGTPVAVFSSAQCDISSHFVDQAIIFDTTICGDWAGAVYPSSGCPGTCDEIVANATNFSSAKWRINYIDVYQ